MLKKMNYINLFKQKLQLGNDSKSDPRVKYFLECKNNFELALPIMDKIIRKTLVLENYSLSKV